MADDVAPQGVFFISRAGREAEFARWLGKLIAAQGRTCVLRDERFGHQNFMGAMDAALKSGARVVGLLSQAYVESDDCLAEAAAALNGDPRNKLRRLILLRPEPCAPGGVLANIAYTNLLDERREADARPLALKVLRALGVEAPRLDGLPPPPEGTLSPSIQVLHSEVQAVPGFAGRKVEIDALEEALWRKGGTAALTNAPASAAAVKGLGGVGKSVLAKEYAWRNRARYQGIWWVRAERRETLANDLIELGTRFIPTLKQMPERDRAARRALDSLEQAGFEKPWLLVYDNVEEPGRIEGLTPRTGAHVLLTTRWSDWGKAAAPVEVGVFAPDVGASFLLEGAGRSDREGAERLAAALGHLPLALDHAAAYIRRSGIDFATYEVLAADLLRKASRGVDYDTPVFATFSLAIDKASETCPEAQKLMGLCAFLAPDRIPLSLFTADVLSETARAEAVAALQEVSLVTLEPLDDGSPKLNIHRLVQATMRGRLRDIGEHENAAALATELVADAFPGLDRHPGDVRNWPVCARLFSHALAALDHAANAHLELEKQVVLASCVAIYAEGRADYSTPHRLKSDSLPLYERIFGAEHPETFVALSNFAQRLQEIAQLPEAEPLMRRALAISEASFGPDHPGVAIRLTHLAGLLQGANRLAEAEPLMRRALAIGEASYGPEHPSVGTRLNNLAQLLQDTGRLAEAEPLMRRALAIHETIFGSHHPTVATSLNNLAELLRATGRLTEAEPLMRRVVGIFERFEGNTGHRHPHYEAALGNLAALEAAMRVAAASAAAKPDGAEPPATPAAPQRQAGKRGFMGGLFRRA